MADPAPLRALPAEPAGPALNILAYRGERLTRRPPNLVAVYVLGALQLCCAGALLVAAVDYCTRLHLFRHWPADLVAAASTVVGLSGVLAAGGMLLWRWAPVRVTSVAQVVYFLGHLVSLLTGCAYLGPHVYYIAIILVPVLVLAAAGLIYVHREDFRAACAWRTSDVWRQWNPQWAAGEAEDADDPEPS